MATKRMFNIEVLLGEEFYQLSFGAQALYSRLSLSADDDGIVSGVKGLVRAMGCNRNHLQELVDGGFVLEVLEKLVITHWKQHNAIAPSRHKPTRYPKVLEQLRLNETDAYELKNTDSLQTNVSTAADDRLQSCKQSAAQTRTEENREEKNREDKTRQEDTEQGAAAPVAEAPSLSGQSDDPSQQKTAEVLSSCQSNGQSVHNFVDRSSLGPGAQGYAEAVLEKYQKLCPDLTPCHCLSEETRRKLMQLKGLGVSLDQIEAAFKTAQTTPFLRGDGERGWKATLDWLCTGDNLRKVQNGVYAPRQNKEKVNYGAKELGEAEIEAIFKLLAEG